MPGTGAFLLLAFASLVVIVLLVLLQLTRLGFLVRSTIPDRPRRRMFIASVSFLITFVGVRHPGAAGSCTTRAHFSGWWCAAITFTTWCGAS